MTGGGHGTQDVRSLQRAAKRCLLAGQVEGARPYLTRALQGYLRRVHGGELLPDETVTALSVALLARGLAGVQALVPGLEACLDLHGDVDRLALLASFAAVVQSYPSVSAETSLPPTEAAFLRAVEAIERNDETTLAAAMRTRHALVAAAVEPRDALDDGLDLPLAALAQLARHRGCRLPDLTGIVPPALAAHAPAW